MSRRERRERRRGAVVEDRWADRRVEHSILRITPEALAVITAAQWNSVQVLLDAHDLRVWKGGFDLPAGYLEWHYGDRSVNGGIAPDGAVST